MSIVNIIKWGGKIKSKGLKTLLKFPLGFAQNAVI